MITELFAAFVMVLTFGILFQAPKKSLWLLGLTGTISWAGFLLSKHLIGNVVIASFIASILVGICGEIFARIMRLPVTVFVIAGIIPLVPGIPAYDTMLFLIKGQYLEGVKTGIDTLMIAGAIALAIAIVGAIPPRIKS
ncbi:hypothetical protein BBF96_03810 [Anoxybacter fermentans]|uniref:Threonine/Serine exporter ThrE domain-containing protein n=1 Tax=Anoxybacter fermentans TaxID=1323375 RepID=A0A3S9T2N4_9FIRM|nr:hypothetical protein BBF96_03810 [Anoxybacter fermentans]